MHDQKNINELLKILDRPAFAVADGCIIAANDAALQREIKIGSQIDPLFQTGKEEYSVFTEGRLHLRLCVADTVWDASVTRTTDADVFLLEHSIKESELRILSLAALQLRAPLAELMALTDRLAENESEESSEAVAKLNRSLLSMQRLVGNMADAPRYTNSVNYPMQTKNITAYLTEIMEKAAVLVEKAGFRFSYEGPTEEIFALISSERLERAIYNLLSNAMKFSPSGSTISIKAKKRGNMVMLTVTDEGNGIQSEGNGNIFSRYLREPAIEDSRIGMGLGMLYVCAAATAHGGTVLLRQPEGKGLSVTVTLSTKNDRLGMLHSNTIPIDYSGGRDHALLELSDVLPYELYEK